MAKHMAAKTRRGGSFLCISLALNVVLLLVLGGYGGYKLYCKWSAGQLSYDYDSYVNTWYEPYVTQYRELSQVEESDVVMCGDSLTMYCEWSEIFTSVDILNRGIGSDVSEGLLDRLDTITATNPSKVFIMIGTNDLNRGYDEDYIVENVAAILDGLCEALPDAEIYLQSVLPRSSLSASAVVSLNARYQELAAERDGVEYVDLYPLFLDEDGEQNLELYATDGTHMSGAGYAVWSEAIRELVED